jgi:N-acetylglucosamine kinase-like BadF-type ATPase
MTAGTIVVAVDGGGSKTDAAVVDRETGRMLARHRGPGCSHHELGGAEAVRRIDATVLAALASAGVPAERVVDAGCYLTAIDLDEDEAIMRPLLAQTAWGRAGLTVANDLFALLRLGTDRRDAAVVVCGTGINGLATRSDGAVARIPALGRCSGDWGGALDLVEEALWLAARAEDRRGRATALHPLVLRWSGLRSVNEVSAAVHRGDLDPASWRDRVPEILAAAREGDAVARDLVERQGREIGVLAAALLERLDLQGGAVPVIVGGGIGGSGDPLLMTAIAAALSARAPSAALTRVDAPPIEGAVALVLDAGAGPRMSETGVAP